jgi:hypothetical protein
LPTNVTPEEQFQAIGRLRKEARDEIDRLIRFLDKTGDYVSRELEDSIDDNPHDEETDDNGEDNEDADPAELSEASGIGDLDGLREQYSGARFSTRRDLCVTRQAMAGPVIVLPLGIRK